VRTDTTCARYARVFPVVSLTWPELAVYQTVMAQVFRNPLEFFGFSRETKTLESEPYGPRWPALSQVAATVERAVQLLDNAITIPGTQFRLGLDPIIGLVPVIGDLVGGAMSLGVLFLAVQYRVPTGIVGVMVFNVVVDTAVGGIPIVGDLFDFVWKANDRNYRLIMKHRGDVTARRKFSYWAKVGGWSLLGAACVVVALR
jgi:Domain of unknown function (DUF4112)